MKNVIARSVIAAISASIIMAAPVNAKAENNPADKVSVQSYTDNMTGYVHFNDLSVSDKDAEAYKKAHQKASSKSKTRRSPRKFNIQDEDWDAYSCDYFYNLLSQKEKTFYDNLSEQAKKVMDSSNNYETFDVSYSNLTSSQLSKVYDIWKETEAQYFFVSEYMNYTNPKTHETSQVSMIHTSDTATIPVMKSYQNGSDRLAARATFLSNINTILSKTDNAPDIWHKEKIIHDELVKRMRYDLTDDMDKQGSASSLIDNSTVCAGYAAAFSVIANKAGIPTISVTSDGIVTGKDDKGNDIWDGAHEWNEVQINSKWYAVDVTWDDLSYGESDHSDYPNGVNLSHKYFNVTDKYLSDNDNDVDSHTTISDIWSDRPVCNSDDGWKPQELTVSSGNFISIIPHYGDTISENLIKDRVKITANGNAVEGSWIFDAASAGKKIDSSYKNRDFIGGFGILCG